MIYLDNNATTRVLPEVLEALLPFYKEFWGNPSSLYPFGAQVAKPIDRARENVASLIGAQRGGEIIFTSGGTESNNLAIRGTLAESKGKKEVITTAVEHPSVLMTCRQLEKEGWRVRYLPVNPNGALDPDNLSHAIDDQTALVSVMWANNETGVIFPIEAIAEICLDKNVPLHVDGTQAVGKIPIDLQKIPANLLSLSGHKIHGPKGIGALYVRRGTKVATLFHGGGQERGRRSGTENAAGIIGLGEAARLAKKRLEEGVLKKTGGLRDALEQKIRALSPGAQINGLGSPRLPNTASISFEKPEGETIALLLGEEGICVSTGSACSAGSLEPSHVLKAMGVPPKQARGTVRFSLSFETTEAEIHRTAEALGKIIR